ncbi:hypothetical protein CJ030_MR7G010003 [Morella rubra]|uniref:Uncharacterized protein n=1 Tax=Morella rubra TaxID=262757 RepID=A0A6A1V4T4_9ROSI|nr:hypothetical protein CJ030_MR7G010003 [Morella rubra]
MSDLQFIRTENPPALTPLLSSNQNHTAPREPQQEEQNGETHLDQTLRKLEKFLTFLGFRQSSWWCSALSWTAFVVIGVALPVVVLELSDCSGCEKYQIKGFELDIVASQACLAAVSLFCLPHNLRKYGIRKFLFVDRFSGQMARFHDYYIKQIWGSLRLLIYWALPCVILKTAREVARILCVPNESWWQSVGIVLALIISWTYFFVVTASQCVTLLEITAYSGIITLTNGGDFAVSTIVQVVGIIICLHAATKITYRAQGVASLASRWHALLTCSATDASHSRVSNNVGNLETMIHLSSVEISYSESDLESLDYIPIPTNAQLASYMSSYHKRQAFGMNHMSCFHIG